MSITLSYVNMFSIMLTVSRKGALKHVPKAVIARVVACMPKALRFRGTHVLVVNRAPEPEVHPARTVRALAHSLAHPHNP